MKKNHILIGAVLMVGLLIGGKYMSDSAAAMQLQKEAAAKAEKELQIQLENEEAHLAQARSAFDTYLNEVEMEKLRMVAEQAEAERLAEIAANTYFIKKAGTPVFSSVEGGENLLNLEKSQQVYVVDRVQDETGVDKWYQIQYNYEDLDTLGWIDASKATGRRQDMISRVYDNVDYEAQSKTTGYESNPMVAAKGIYVTGYSAASGKIDDLIALADRTAINAFVIDVKDDNGNMLFYSETAEKYSPSGNNRFYIKDMDAFMTKMKENNIYTIARIVTFKSPRYAKDNPDKAILRRSTGAVYQSQDGVRWASPYDRDLWDYNVGVAKEAAALGFNEIQFDYVRFPASGGGKLDSSLDYRNYENESKAEAIQKFLKYAYSEISKDEVYVSADVFGWVASATNDVGIGQHWEALTNVVDFMCPMMYPSHYGPGNYGLSVPDAFPYETIDRGIKDALNRDAHVDTPAKLRPWIQDFTAKWVKGYIHYGPAEVEAQIRALEDNGVNEYLLWNAGNWYTEGGIQ